MSKDMDVQIHPLEDRMDLAAKARRLMKAKRLTDAELAAEHWLHCWTWERSVANNDAYDGMPETRELKRRATILERFATLPHYDERPAS